MMSFLSIALFFLIVYYVHFTYGWRGIPTVKRSLNTLLLKERNPSTNCRSHFKPSRHLFSIMNENEHEDSTKKLIDDLLSKHKVVLFMKGTKLFPQCGFSNTAVRILEALNVSFETVNVLEDERIRAGIKLYSNWPTIPQLYVNKEFIGGSDIMIQMYNTGELAETIELASAK